MAFVELDIIVSPEKLTKEERVSEKLKKHSRDKQMRVN
jgi:hypothetical protein